MEKEKNNKMEQSSKENEVTKNEVAKAGFVNDEMQTASVNVTNTAMPNVTTVQKTIMVPADAVEFETYCSDTIDGDGTLYSDEGGWVGYYYPQNKYYYAKCWIKAEDVGVLEENFKNGTLSLRFSNESSGMKVFDFLTLDGEYLGSWGDEIDVAEVYNEETGEAEFKIVPAQGCTGSIIIAKTDITVTVSIIKSYTNIAYGNENLQKMDIHIPETPKGPNGSPAVITIHGGDWSVGSINTCDKQYYNYMTEFITDTCNCVHVNMNYRLMGTNGGLDTAPDAKAPYKQMLDDIQAVINFISRDDNSSTYHIDTSNIALMGYSAGGHLALLYAYTHPTQIDLVISEAGPTTFMDFSHIDLNNLENRMKLITALEGFSELMRAQYRIEDYEAGESFPQEWVLASPSNYTSASSPYTILAYGNGVSCGNGIFGDDTVPFFHAEAIQGVFEDLINPANYYTLFTLNGVEHGEFGEGQKVCPNSQISGEWENTVENYYDKIQEKLT